MPDLTFREYSLDHERDTFVMDLRGPGRRPDSGFPGRGWCSTTPNGSRPSPGPRRRRFGRSIVGFLRANARRARDRVTFRHLEDGWVDTPEPQREGGTGGAGRAAEAARGSERRATGGRESPARAAGQGPPAPRRPPAEVRAAPRDRRRGPRRRETPTRRAGPERHDGRASGGRRRRWFAGAADAAEDGARRRPAVPGRRGPAGPRAMIFELTEEQRAIRDMVRAFAEREIAPGIAHREATHEFPREIVAKMGELGLLGMMIPSEYGGAGARRDLLQSRDGGDRPSRRLAGRDHGREQLGGVLPDLEIRLGGAEDVDSLGARFRLVPRARTH